MEAASATVYVIDKVLRLLKDEADLFREAKIDLGSLKRKLERRKDSIVNMNESDWLMDAELTEATKAAQHAEFVLDMYLLQNMAERRHRRGFIYMLLQKGDHLTKTMKPQHVALEIKRIIEKTRRTSKDLETMKNWNEDLYSYSGDDELEGNEEGSRRMGKVTLKKKKKKKIKKMMMVMGIEEGSRRTSNDLRFVGKSYGFVEEDELVGIQSQKEELVSMLVGEPSTHLVISLVGGGGVGKTTLASVVYQSEEVRNRFDFHAWVTLSQYSNFKDLFRHLTHMICEDGDASKHEMDAMEEQELISCLKQHLSTKRYLLILDDLWRVDFWDIMNHVFPNSNNGSRVIITTRNNATVPSCHIFKCLQPLSKDMAWELFCKRAFETEHGNCPHELLDLSHEIVRRCHGLPLVIEAISGHLSTRSNLVSEWTMMQNHFDDGFRENPLLYSEVSGIFSRSLHELPFHIRLCFLYFGILPKDLLIPDQRLFMLWIAEGFVKEEIGRTLEQVAEIYLDELINRNLVQISHVMYDGIERMCTVHGFMHELLVAKAKQFEIGQVFEDNDSTSFVDPESRRLSIYGGAINTLRIPVEHARVRSVFLFDVHGTVMTNSLVVSLFERFKLLELLDFENAPMDDLPIEVGNLFFLKYLSLKNTKVKKLPKSVALLLSLQTLDVRNTQVDELPTEIQKLRKLRHLLASAQNDKDSLYSVHGTRIKEGIGFLENLQTLMTVEGRSSGFGVIKELKKLRQLRCLSISKLDALNVNILCTSIEKMTLLESLSLYSSNNHQTLDLESISAPPPLLRRLILKGRLEKLPNWILRLQNLSMLGLSFSGLSADPLEALNCLPTLESLLLHRAYDGEQLHFDEGSFPQLKRLVLTELHELKMIKIQREALPILEALTIGPSPLLNEVPSGVEHLSNLKVLANYDMPTEFVLSMQPDGGSDYWKVQHVPSVLFCYRVQGRSYISYTLGESDLLDYLQGLATNRNAVAQHDFQSCFYFSDGEEDSASTSIVRRNASNRLSFSSDRFSFFTDDIED